MYCETHNAVVLPSLLRSVGCLFILTALIFVLVAVPVPSESQVDVDPFVTTWRTTTPGESITIPTGGTGGAYTVDWGDGTISDSVSGDQPHVYAEPGDYQISISGDFTRIFLNGMPNAEKLLSIDQWGAIQWSSMESSFNGASNMAYRATDTPDLSVVRSMSHMFYESSSFNGDLSGWDVSGVTDMANMFSKAHSFNSDVSGWDVSGVTDMNEMFNDARSFNSDLSGWDVSAVTGMSYMFAENDSFNSDLSGWDVSAVTDMDNMFGGAASFNSDLSGWDVSAVTDMSEIFGDASSFNSDISGWDVSNVADMSSMFSAASSFDGDISGWDTSSVTDMSGMFYFAISFNSDLSDWDTSSVTDMGEMFRAASSFDGDISGWDVSNVADMSSMFRAASSFDGDISGWDVSNVADMSAMFFGASSFNGDISGWDTSSVTAMYYTFRGVPTSKIGMSHMFRDASSFNGDLSGWDVSDVVDMSSMFSGASSFNGDISGWDTSSVTGMAYMFSNAASFNGDISDWDVSSATSMNQMLSGAFEFDQNLGKWYIVLDSTSIEYDGTTLHVATISPQNVWLMNNHDIVYSIGNTGDGDRFEINGNVLKFKSAPDDTQDSYALTILSSGDFGQSNSKAAVITVTGIPLSIPLNIDTGDDRTVREGATVTLSGTVIDAGSGTLTYSWSDDSALDMEFDPALQSITFEAPQVDSETTVTFTLEVSDDTQTVTDTVRVTIQDVTSGSDFITTWGTVMPGESVTIPARGTYAIDWGDGTIEDDVNGSQTHTYDSAGDHTVRISGDITEIRLDNHADAHKLVSIDQWGDSQWTSMYSAFRGASNMTYNAADVPDLSRVTDMDNMFDGASSFDGDLSAWDVSNVNDMSYMFKDATSFNSDISAWDVSNVNDMSEMFWHASSFDGDVSDWDVSRVTDMYGMFANASSFNGDVSNWDVSRVTDMADMFNRAISFNGDVSNWDVSRVTDMADMFRSASSFNSDISGWNIADTTRINAMLFRADAFDQNLGLWYIVLDDDTISGSDVPDAIGNISTRNPYLDGQNPEYAVGSGEDSDYFEISGNVLRMLSVPDGHVGPYTVGITSTGDYGTDNSRTYEITVISSDITSLNSTVDPEPGTAVDTQVDPEPVETSQNSAGFSEPELQALREWDGSSEHVGDDKFLNVFGIEGTTVPNYFKGATQWFIDGALGKQELIGALSYLQDQGLLE